MASSTLFNTSTPTLGEVFANGKSYVVQKVIYTTSQFELARRITSDEWTHVALTARQNFLANQAVTVWKLSYQ